MHLSPRERAVFDEIVSRLRSEDNGAGTLEPRWRSLALLVSVVVAMLALMFGLAVLVRRPEVIVPVMAVCALLACALIAWKAHARSS